MNPKGIVGPFVKSTFSGQQDNCVEVAPLSGGGRAVRDSKDKAGAKLWFSAEGWGEFIAGVRGGGLG
ncbi:DUF397 domain-containing protein [Streptomyces olivoreticuli]